MQKVVTTRKEIILKRSIVLSLGLCMTLSALCPFSSLAITTTDPFLKRVDVILQGSKPPTEALVPS